MRVYDKFYINGEWVDPVTPKSLDVINPANEQVCATISIGSAADVDKAAMAARNAFATFGRSAREERIAILAALVETIRSA
jgi:aldehyde dehydrogenase (NAD+)